MEDVIERGKDGILDKSRDMGATWLASAVAVWLWLFKPRSAVGFGSRKLELVDKKGDPKTIFDKIRTIIDNLPPWLMQAKANGYIPKVHDNHCKIINPSNGATITGEAGDEIGRGGRTTVYFVDEAAFLARPRLIDRSLSANSRSIIYISTPRGSNNPFAQKRFSKRYPVFSLHWRKDPRKTYWAVVRNDFEPFVDQDQEFHIDDDKLLSYGMGDEPVPEDIPEGYRLIYPWYEAEVLEKDEVTVAQEYDIDYSASLEGVVIPAKWLRACVGLKLQPGPIRVAGYDVAAGGSAEHVFATRSGPVIEGFTRFRAVEPAEGAVKVVALCEEKKAAKLFFDIIGVGAGIAGVAKIIRRVLSFEITGVRVSNPASSTTVWPDKLTSKEKFHNERAELWWLLRERARKTFEYVHLGFPHKEEELLSLPYSTEAERRDTEDFITQASNITYKHTPAGKKIIESKEELRARNVSSPDLADAVCLTLAHKGLSSERPLAGGTAPLGRSTPAEAARGQAPRPKRKVLAG